MFRRLMLGLMLAASLLLLAPTPEAEASDWGWSALTDGQVSWGWWRRWRWRRDHYRDSYGGDDDRHSGTSAPELDPGGAGSALVLLIGGVAYIASRRREEEDAI